MEALAPPFFAVEGGDVLVFDSVERMASHLEAIDVRRGVYEFYDARGRPLVAALEEYAVDSFRAAPDADPNPQALEGQLRSFFRRLPDRYRRYRDLAGRAASLEELVSLRQDLDRRDMSRHFRHYWEQNLQVGEGGPTTRPSLLRILLASVLAGVLFAGLVSIDQRRWSWILGAGVAAALFMFAGSVFWFWRASKQRPPPKQR